MRSLGSNSATLGGHRTSYISHPPLHFTLERGSYMLQLPASHLTATLVVAALHAAAAATAVGSGGDGGCSRLLLLMMMMMIAADGC